MSNSNLRTKTTSTREDHARFERIMQWGQRTL